MNKLRFPSILALAVTFAVATTPVTNHTAVASSNLELQFGGERFDPTGTVRADGNLNGDNVNLESDLDLDEEESLSLGLRHQTRGTQGFRASYTNVEFTGKNSPDNAFTYEDQSFSSLETVESELRFRLIDFDLEYRLTAPDRNDFFNLAFGGRWVDFKGVLENSSGTKREKSTFETGIPVAGVHFRKYLVPRIYIEGRWQGMDAELDDNEMQYLDGEVSLGISPVKDFWLVGSYSDLRIEGTNNDDHFDLKFTGPKLATRFYF